MKLIEEDRLNLIDFLSKTNCYEQLPEELEKGKTGLDRERWSNLIQKLIDNNEDS
jgi:hypothetical protein